MAQEQYIEPEQRITSSGQIAALLKRLHEERSLLSVSFPDSNERFNSAVLEVDAGEGFFTLDELNPRSGHDRLQPGSVLRVEGYLQGVDTRFLVTVGSIEQEGGIFYYRAPLPEFLIYRQRRQFHRVPVRLTLNAAISLAEGAPSATKARLTDLSAGGIGGVVLEGAHLAEGSKLVCSIQLPGQPELRLAIEIRFARVDARGQQRFGAMFLDVSPMDHRRLARTVMDLERELRRLT